MYRFRAVGAHALHSPFVFRLYCEVIKPARRYRMLSVEQRRIALKKDYTVLDLIDLKTQRSFRKSVSFIARTSLSKPRFSAFLRLLTEQLGAKRVLETGTSLGINALYMASATSVEKLITIESSPALAYYAQKSFSTLTNTTIQLVQGTIYDVFVSSIVQLQPELYFLDADHRSSAIAFYLDAIMTHTPSVKCIVIHDIYWSKDMASAWECIVKDPRFSLTVDLYQAGLIFPNQAMPKQHFTLRT